MTNKHLGAIIVILTVVASFLLGLVVSDMYNRHDLPTIQQYLIPIYGPG